MLETLLESRRLAKHQYRYTIVSVTAHAAAIAAGLFAATAAGATRVPRTSPVPPITYVAVSKPEITSGAPIPQAAPDAGSRPAIPVIVAPDIVIADRFPDTPLPWPRASSDSLFANGGNSGEPGPVSTAGSGGTGEAPAPVLSGVDVDRVARVRTRIEPRYPPALRAAGIEGRVIVRFVVDTAGRVEEASIQVLDSSHPQFTDAVRTTLGRMRFEPARVGRSKVRQMVDLPFTFELSR